MQELRVVKSRADGVLVLVKHQFTSYTAEGKQRRAVSGIEEYERLLRDEFQLPWLPVRAPCEPGRRLPAQTWTPKPSWRCGRRRRGSRRPAGRLRRRSS
jgi:hypothetical protein